jgi:hypothetical protein
MQDPRQEIIILELEGESSDAASNVRAKIQNKGIIILEIVYSDAMNNLKAKIQNKECSP